MENWPLAALIERLEPEPRVWVRLAATRQGDWQIKLMEVTMGGPPPGWRRCRWRYPSAVFIATTRSGEDVAKWLIDRRVRLRPPHAPLALTGWANPERRESGFEGLVQALDWPSMVWTVSTSVENTGVPHGELVAADSPAFLTFDQAAATFFLVPARPIRNFGGHDLIVREQDRRARIDGVVIRPAELVVRVQGDRLDGTRLTLGGATGPAVDLRPGVDEIRLPLSAPLADGAWLALHHGTELLDRRILDPAYRDRGVEIELDTLTRAQILIGRGEGPAIEFKRDLPGKEPRRVMKTVAAFANGDGGTLLFGVDDGGDVVGLAPGDASRARDRVAALLTDWVRPRVDFDLVLTTIDGAAVLVADIRAGAHSPYGVGTSDREITYYVRRGATSFPATPDDVRAFVRSRIPQASGAWPRR